MTSPNAWDFAGTSLPSAWEFVGGSTAQYYTQNNGATVHIGDENGTCGVGLKTTFSINSNYGMYAIISNMANLASSSGETAGIGMRSSTSYGVGYGSYNSYEASSIFSTENLPGGFYRSSSSTAYTLTSGSYYQVPDTIFKGVIGTGYTGLSSMFLYSNHSGYAFYNFQSSVYRANMSLPLTANFGIWNGAYNQTVTASAIFFVPYISMPTFTIGTGNSTAFTHEIILESD